MSYERQPIANHASGLAAAIQGNLKRSLEAIGVVCPSQHLGPSKGNKPQNQISQWL